MFINKKTFKDDFKRKLINMYAEDIDESSSTHKYFALAALIKDYASQNWMKSNKEYTNNKDKQIYYFSMEFLIGRLLHSNLLNLGILDTCKEALEELNINLEKIEEVENDAGLGNGGLGRLAACFLDSMASLGIPGHGNGIRYTYGLFEQQIIDGYQVEKPDEWLKDGNIWEVRKENKSVKINFGGKVVSKIEDGKLKFKQEDCETILAVPYDTPIIGYNNPTVNTLRLWSAEPITKDFDFQSFSRGEYLKAIEYKTSIESISQVLYPDDSTNDGKILRLKQQYFFVSAGIQSIVRRYKKLNEPINKFSKYIAIHINDTHPSLAVAELMRLLIDEENLSWDEAWSITVNTIAYTNHTILSEALEKWPIDMFKKLLPRIYMIVEEINRRFTIEIREKYKDENTVNSMGIIGNGQIRMAHLAIVGSHSVNGVAKLHTELLKNQELKDFNDFYPNKFNNKTNGITHRRWLLQANPKLSNLITEAIGDNWIKDINSLKSLESFSNDSSFKEKFEKIKLENKIAFSNYAKTKFNMDIDPNSIFDVQVKRLHAYKRQILNLFNIMDLYRRIKENPNLDITPRTFFFGAKAAPSYYLAKKTIKLINTVAYRVNNDAQVNNKIKIFFLPNYSVSLAEKIIPCAQVSEQISTATKEASGTGNMKFMMNGALTLATLDGANIEIKDAVGNDNIVIFGITKEEVLYYMKNRNYNPYEYYNNDFRIKLILDSLINGSLGVPSDEFTDIYNSLLKNNDEYFVLRDFSSYVEAQGKIDSLYRNKENWNRMCIINVANSGMFSSDNTINNYYEEIWR
ncbi:starch phosphorylase [Clostridium tetanomorphum]|uniref:Alpha-1,4 glucan phosphorylase n=1 Tax=Clostridium tetanomorphum TaxID=1553 RepID=A0A923J259_CLOTT|nr:glycogen/starch/alpha-glucan phosphorylase [Clostridium tetanomorphum]KAJ49791.1 Glycogen phosphorylase [Clostridium tetanomorphum DSM 665]MBC2398123.1 glycogen/starch/alpha-glucan phosphorylase [Clostridium tetanomorphum]MBP1864692.1 starch phosphorylase [Clostridium tetanomorphum]NRS84162.1 starch phosphorylase [Clostridium tetanomorphum]NRZ97375.1 starch phosphorylase [Clostridium tetanomorphum]